MNFCLTIAEILDFIETPGYPCVFTTFGMNENNAAQYVFQFYAADPETPRTGDTSLSMLVALMAVSALGIVVVTSKKKEF